MGKIIYFCIVNVFFNVTLTINLNFYEGLNSSCRRRLLAVHGVVR